MKKGTIFLYRERFRWNTFIDTCITRIYNIAVPLVPLTSVPPIAKGYKF